MASFRKLVFPTHFLLTLTSILVGNLLCLPFGHGHLGSIFDDGELKPPTLEHTRSSRVPLLHSPERLDIGRLPFLRHPSYTHKYLSNQRLLKFHQGSPSIPSGRIRDSDLPTSDASMERLLNRLDKDTENGGGEVSSDSPTFTPYVSARALSNMEKFFHHLRENLEALQKGNDDEDEEDSDNGSHKDEEESSGSGSPEKALASSYQLSPSTPEWKPRASGVLGLKKIRSFFPLSQTPESRTRMGTNLGLGRKRRR